MLIELVLEILREVKPGALAVKHVRVRRRIGQLQKVLRALRDSPAEVVESTETASKSNSELVVRLTGNVARRYLSLSGGVGRALSTNSTVSRTSTTRRRKESYLRDLAPALANALEKATAARQKGALLVVLDDFYFIAKETQPMVLDHLHGITKRSKVWLKIGSVHSRTRSYVEGDPPLGMQPPNDLQHVSLDVGLSEFLTAKAFLEDVADGVLQPHGLKVRDVLTSTARERAVLVAGGAVARDYFDLLIASADAEWENAQSGGSASSKAQSGGFRIGAESVQAAAGRMLERKQTDLRNDAGRDAPGLELRFADLVAFARDRDTYFFLVKRSDIDSEWGREIVELEDLRFVHRIMVTRPNTGSMRRVDTIVFMVDIPALVDKRMQKIPVEFWKPRKSDELRKASWVYEPEWVSLNKARRSGSAGDTDMQLVLESIDAEEGRL
ncbi:hypothetical protein FE251_09240 [Georgenia wutianyii]|uniref:Uncharacterized protein n=1 Tax=Georgenia wutianyii TaxID=2585135 RepID=A0ABX5VQ60_9MICO|nr:hypothetical protein [Georgenia wutianyii]QDB79538.1 hypothetical protein FE251_09240 [Georgenia wutianyii]